MDVVMVKLCKLQYIIASWIEFLDTLDKLDVKGLELKKEKEDQKRGKMISKEPSCVSRPMKRSRR